MKIINPEVLLKNIENHFALLALVEDQGTIKIQSVKASLTILKNLIKDSIEDTNDEKK